MKFGKIIAISDCLRNLFVLNKTFCYTPICIVFFLIGQPHLILYKIYKNFNMTSASSSSARTLFADSKSRLADRVQVNVNNIASLTRQIQRGSKTNETLIRSAREFSQVEHCIDNTEANLKKMELIGVHLGYQNESMIKSAQLLEEITEQVAAMQR